LTQVIGCLFLNNQGGGVAFQNSVGTMDLVSSSVFLGNGGLGLSNQFYMRSISGCSFAEDIILSYGQNMMLSNSAFSDSNFCEFQTATKTKCPVCTTCQTGPTAVCGGFSAAVYGAARAELLCNLDTIDCTWTGNKCVANANSGNDVSAEVVSGQNLQKQTATSAPIPILTPGAICTQINQVKSESVRVPMCRQQKGCVVVKSKCAAA
jgi:hypothetical protein